MEPWARTYAKRTSGPDEKGSSQRTGQKRFDEEDSRRRQRSTTAGDADLKDQCPELVATNRQKNAEREACAASVPGEKSTKGKKPIGQVAMTDKERAQKWREKSKNKAVDAQAKKFGKKGSKETVGWETVRSGGHDGQRAGAEMARQVEE